MSILKRFFKVRESTLIIINIIFIIILAMLFENFSSRGNVLGLLYYISIYSIIAGSMTVLIVSGGFDLSVGVILGFSGMLVGKFIVTYNLPIILSIILAILICAIIGTINGYIIAHLNINPFFATLSTYFIIGALNYIIANKKDISGFPQNFNLIVNYKLFNIPILIIISIASLVIFDVLLRKNIYFRQNYAMGGNEIGAIQAGIKVRRVKMLNYTIVGAMASIAGILFASRSMTSYRNAGADAAFIIITAVIIGGASLKGGRGTVAGTFLGLVLMALINNAIIFFKLHAMWGKIIVGLILILVVLLDENIRRERTIILKT